MMVSIRLLAEERQAVATQHRLQPTPLRGFVSGRNLVM
jgi:hypothetical protein